MGKALYRKYRSRSLDEVVGQDHVTSILKNALKQKRIGHAYLFTGPRGVGKTSIARILAHEINELPYSDETDHLDIIEIDAASNNGVDDIRDLREKVSLAPTTAQKKVYIIDEVHMLSKSAFNALLKTLEEPPEHVVFILATTDADKLPDTVISRTQRFSFKLASKDDLIANLTRIATAESIPIDEDALALIAEYSSGSYRDSVSLLDQLATIHSDDKNIEATDIETALGLASHTSIEQLLDHVKHTEFTQSIDLLQQLLSRGIQPSVVALQMVQLIQASLDRHYALLPLIEKLIMVRQSSMPEALLLSIIGTHAHGEKAHTANAAVATKSPSIEIPALVKKATQNHPKDDVVPPTPPTSEPETTANLSASTPSSAIDPIDWTHTLTGIEAVSIGLRTVLAKCSLANEGSTVIIFARNEFYKKKLDTPKYRKELSQFLQEKTGTEWTLDIRPIQAPSKNKTVAAVTAIMGGGEEVSIE